MKLCMAIMLFCSLTVTAADVRISVERKVRARSDSPLVSAGLECSRSNPLRGKPHIKPRPDTPHNYKYEKPPRMEPKKEFSTRFIEHRLKMLRRSDPSIPTKYSSRATKKPEFKKIDAL